MVAVRSDSEPSQQSSIPSDDTFSHAGNEASSNRADRSLWFKKPSLAWILFMKTLSAIAVAMTAGPRVEIYTELVCRGYSERVEAPASGFLQIGLPASSITGTSGLPDHSGSPDEVYLPPDNQLNLTLRGNVLQTDATHAFGPSGRCGDDPTIQAEVAKLSAAIAIISGILSCLTTGWWGGWMDRHGRTRTMGTIAIGPLLSDFLIFFVFFFSDKLPGKYWFLVTAPIMEGIMGAPSSTMAAETSYMRDVSESQNLARNFSLLIGIFFAGGTVGPVIGGFVNERAGSVIAAFYAATALHLTYGIVAWFAMPESINAAEMVNARNRYAEELASVADTHLDPFRRWLVILTKSFWDSFPLNVLMPKPSPNSRRRKDWNLTWLAISAGLINIVVGSGNSVYQYALYTFKWSSLDLGYFISASGLSTVVFLLVILPTTISIWKRGAQDPRQNTLFDLNIVRVSTMMFAAGYCLMGIAPTGIIFTLFSVISTFGLGFLPAVQSVATILHAGVSGEADTGRLFGALGVVYVLGGRIVGPALYGMVYVLTVSFLPSAIFLVSAGCSLMALLVLALVRLPNGGGVSGARHVDRDLSDDVDPESAPLLGH